MTSPNNPATPRGTLWPAANSTWLVAALCCVWFGFLAGLRPLSLPDEGRYLGIAWEMLRSKDWLTPTLDGLPFFHKPPLFYWVTALSLEVFGPHEWAARVCSILAATASVAAVFSTVRERAGVPMAKLAALVLATQPLFYGAAQFANLDMLVAACITLAILFGARAAWAVDASMPYRGSLALAYVAAALGVLAKGLIGLVLPGLVLLLWLGLAGRWRTMRRLFWLSGFAIVAVMVMPWFAALQWQYPGFFHYFFIVQQVERFASTGFNNVEPAWFYLPVLLVFVLPWSGWLLALRRAPLVRAWKVPVRLQPTLTSLMLVWLVVVVLFFSIPQSKLIGYVLPALAPLAVLVVSIAMPLLRTSARARGLWRLSTGAAASLCVGIVIAFALSHPKSSRDLAGLLSNHRFDRAGVAFIDEYSYDVPFYLHDDTPITVVANWDPVEVRKHDNWQKELADAGAFAPSLAGDRLVGDVKFRSVLCEGRVKWVIARSERLRNYPFLSAASVVATEGKRTLWHTDTADPHFRAALGCSASNVQLARLK